MAKKRHKKAGALILVLILVMVAAAILARFFDPWLPGPRLVGTVIAIRDDGSRDSDRNRRLVVRLEDGQEVTLEVLPTDRRREGDEVVVEKQSTEYFSLNRYILAE